MSEPLLNTLEGVAQQLDCDALITLFYLDALRLGAATYRFCSQLDNGHHVSFGGFEFPPIPVTSSGWDITSNGALPRPTMQISTLSPAINGLIREFGDGVGAIIHRIQTFERFLDGHANPDGTMCAVDIYRVERKTDEAPGYISWELATPFDIEGAKIPGRQILRDTCTHIYRMWDPATNSFNYDIATCPYAGSRYFSANGNAVSLPSLDICGKRLSDCEKRFVGQPLPTRAFPGVARVRV